MLAWTSGAGLCNSVLPISDQIVFQMQIARNQEAVPLTRDYITEWERAHGGKSAAAE